LIAAILLSGRKLTVARGELKHIAIAGFLNVGLFLTFSALAIKYGATSRAVIITYSMPSGTAALEWQVLRERLDRYRAVALFLCITGLTILIWPLFAAGIPFGVVFSLGCAIAWAAATVYVKWATLKTEPLTNAAWQLIIGCAALAVAMLVMDGYPRLWPISTTGLLLVVLIGVIGVGLPHFLWWSIVQKLPASTSALGTLLVPVVGVTASALILGEHLTASDILGFASIFAAAACVLLQPGAKPPAIPE
jgi:drug/metabolite transporter (DMT)-like permease